MSAVLPFLEDEDAEELDNPAFQAEFELTPQESATEQGTVEEGVGLGGYEDGHVFATEGLTAEVLNASHAGLVQTAWLRESAIQALEGATYQVVVVGGMRAGSLPRLELHLDEPVIPKGEHHMPWNPPASPNARRFKVLSWTSKMGAPSFSLPAGPLEAGGSCPGAAAGQSIVPADKLRKAAKIVSRETGEPVRLQQAICQFCYAEGGQYATGQVQFAQVLRYAWTQTALRTERGTEEWIDAMVFAVQNAQYLLDGGRIDKTTYEPERFEGRFFRIHDSGDFFSPKYVRAWKEVANRCPDVLFWAPTRCWATSWGVDVVNEVNAQPDNLIIRPSSYHVNEPPPRALGPGWAAGSTTFDKKLVDYGEHVRDFDWNCRAYSEDKNKTCRNALAPDGKVGCRACWGRPLEEINYTLH